VSVKSVLESHDITDGAILRHGFVPYNRDYFVIVQMRKASADLLLDEIDVTWNFLFRGCVYEKYISRVLSFSMDDRFVDYDQWEDSGAPEGFVWGVDRADAYPGLFYKDDSKLAFHLAKKFGLELHHVEIQTNTYDLILVFHDVSVSILNSEQLEEE
jgi:hypothetical protein